MACSDTLKKNTTMPYGVGIAAAWQRLVAGGLQTGACTWQSSSLAWSQMLEKRGLQQHRIFTETELRLQGPKQYEVACSFNLTLPLCNLMSYDVSWLSCPPTVLARHWQETGPCISWCFQRIMRYIGQQQGPRPPQLQDPQGGQPLMFDGPVEL